MLNCVFSNPIKNTVRIVKWKPLITLLGVFVILALLLPLTEARKGNAKTKIRLHTRPEWTRRKAKNSECRLGGTGRYALNSTWSPNLGPPFGVWSCVKCTCTPVHKKRRIVAKVVCRNIKNECPPAKCSVPILSPGACCKRCPEDDLSKDGFQIQKQEPNIEDLSAKDFAVLLNGRTATYPQTGRNLATGRIFLRRGTLHFSFVLGPDTPPPRSIEFLDKDGNILEELEAQPTPYEVNNGRVCGSWTRVPRQYRTVLLRENMWVSLVPEDENDAISGRIARYKGVDTEVFSSLLSPNKDDNETLPGGGTAIISVSAPSDSLHISLVFNGIFESLAAKEVSLTIELVPTRVVEPIREVIVLEKVYSDINQAELLTTLGNSSLRLLTRGKVSMKLWATDSPHLGIEGLITARATCNVYSSTLTSAPMEENPSYGAGWALLFVSNEGDFEYQVRVEEPPAPVRRVTLHSVSKRKTRQVEDITESYKEGWANGTYTKPTYRELDMLLRGRLVIRMTLANGHILEGYFQSISVTEALRTFHPTLLKNTSSWLAATAWLAVDSACVVHYDIYIAGEDPGGRNDPTWSLRLRENDTSWDPRLDFKNETLESIITGREIAAHTTMLTKISLTRLLKGVSYLDLTVATNSKPDFEDGIVLTGRVEGTTVPPHCLLGLGNLFTGDKDKPSEQPSPCIGRICILQDKQQETKVASKKCIDDEKNVYEDGTTWPSPASHCQKCMCTLGHIYCQEEPCPAPSCVDPVKLPGHCCPSCPVSSAVIKERVCELDKELHSIGSFWHPFLAPKGFNRCVTCYCNLTSSMEPKVDCEWMKCPKLPCPTVLAEVVEGSCCRRCPATTAAPPTKNILKDMIRDTGEERLSRRDRILRNGGCLERQEHARKNGETWLPERSPMRRNKCIFCTCKDGQMNCFGKRCFRGGGGGGGGKHCAVKNGGKGCRRTKTKIPSSFQAFTHRKRKNRRNKNKNKGKAAKKFRVED